MSILNYDSWLLSGLDTDEDDAPALNRVNFSHMSVTAAEAYREQLDQLWPNEEDIPDPLTITDIENKLWDLYNDDLEAWANDWFMYAPTPAEMRDEARAER